MARENAVTKAIKGGAKPRASKPQYNAWVEGRFILYKPTFFPSHEVKDWGGRWEGKQEAWRLPRLVRMARRIREYDTDAIFTKDVERLVKGEIEKQDALVFMANLQDEAERHPAWKELKDYQKQA